MARKTLEEAVRPDRNRHEVRRVSDGVFFDIFQVVLTSGSGYKHIGSPRWQDEAVRKAREAD